MADVSLTAQQIYQDLLDRIGSSIVFGDFESYRTYFELPHRFETFEKRLLISTLDELKSIFEGTCEHLRTIGIQELSRSCTLAEFSDPQTIKGCHDTRLIAPDNRVMDGYSALSTLRLRNGAWRVAESQYAETNLSLPSSISKKTDGKSGR